MCFHLLRRLPTLLVILANMRVGALLAAPSAPLPRVDFGAKLEPNGRVVTGAGQVETDDALAYARALGGADPVIFMDYVDAHPPKPDAFFDELQQKLARLPWYAVPQIGLGFDDDAGKPYDVAAAAGDYDANLRRIAARLATLGRPAYLRIGYEFHGSWNGYTPEAYRAVFRRVHRFLQEAGAREVATVWCAEAGALPADYLTFYPGDDVVDWWAIDFFSKEDFHGNPVVETFVADARRRHKPVMIGESTPRYTTTLRGEASWNAWFVPYFDFIERHDNVKAFCYINWDWAVYAKRYSASWSDWGDCRLQQNPVVAAKFAAQVRQPLYLLGGSAEGTRRALRVPNQPVEAGAR